MAEPKLPNFVCPETREAVSLASASQLDALRSAIEGGKVRRADGGSVPTTFDGAYLTSRGHRAYVVIDGIPNFIIEERLEISPPLSA